MKFGVLALDYDGTIARDGVLDPEVRAAIADVRAHGIVVILVTGRILSELKQVAGDTRFVDAVVGENGGVMEFPNGYTRLIGHPPSEIFVDELRKRGVEFKQGQCVVEADATFGQQILAVIQQLELPLTLLFNHGRVMVLPQAVCKSQGLHHALTALRLSVHNAISIGDAENDHDLLAACEIGVAVSWGSPALQKVADEILVGDGPNAVAAYIRLLAVKKRLTPEAIHHHHLTFGTAEDGSFLKIAIRGRNMLITGDPLSGKSWVAGLACEQLILQGYSVCVIDPEGDYRTLESLPGVVVLGGDEPPPDLPDVARVLRHPDMSLVVDLSHVPYREKVAYLKALLPMLASLRRSTGLPHRIVIDEAHYFLHEPNVKELLDLTLGAYTLVTYHLSDLHPDLQKAIEGVIVKRTTNPHEVKTLSAIAHSNGNESAWKDMFGSLAIREAILLPGIEEAKGRPVKFEVYPRLTSHVHHKAKYMDVQLIREQGFIFSEQGQPTGLAARTLKDFVLLLCIVPSAVLEEHAGRGDFSRWIADVFHDHALASSVRKVEQRFRLGHIRELRTKISNLVQERYEIQSSEASSPDVSPVPVVSLQEPIGPKVA